MFPFILKKESFNPKCEVNAHIYLNTMIRYVVDNNYIVCNSKKMFALKSCLGENVYSGADPGFLNRRDAKYVCVQARSPLRPWSRALEKIGYNMLSHATVASFGKFEAF